jgi:hypothetical protein
MKTLPTTSVKKTSILATFLTTFLIALPSCSVKKEVTATGESAGGTTLPQSNPAGSGAGCDFSKHSRSFGESAGKEIKEPTSVAMEKLEIVSLHYSRLSENNGAQKSSSLFEFSGDDAENLKSDCYGSSDGSIVISAGQQDSGDRLYERRRIHLQRPSLLEVRAKFRWRKRETKRIRRRK